MRATQAVQGGNITLADLQWQQERVQLRDETRSYKQEVQRAPLKWTGGDAGPPPRVIEARPTSYQESGVGICSLAARQMTSATVSSTRA